MIDVDQTARPLRDKIPIKNLHDYIEDNAIQFCQPETTGLEHGKAFMSQVTFPAIGARTRS